MFASNLAVSLAQAGQRVLHVDADMRRPRVHEIFELPQEPGLVEPAGRRLQAERGGPKMTEHAEPVGAAGGHDPAQPGGAARLEAVLRSTSRRSASTSTG